MAPLQGTKKTEWLQYGELAGGRQSLGALGLWQEMGVCAGGRGQPGKEAEKRNN